MIPVGIPDDSVRIWQKMTGSKLGGFREILDRFPGRTAKVLLNAAMAWDALLYSVADG